MKLFKNSYTFLSIILLAVLILFIFLQNRSLLPVEIMVAENRPLPNRILASNITVGNPIRLKAIEVHSLTAPLRFENSKQIVEWLKQQDDSKYFDFVEDENLGALLSTDYTQIYIFQQTYKGYKVFDQNVRLILKKSTNELIRVKSKLAEIPELTTERYMPLTLTQEKVTARLGIDPQTISSSMLHPEIYIQEKKSYLIWRFAQKESLVKDAEWTLFVDAQNGNILRRESNRIY